MKIKTIGATILTVAFALALSLGALAATNGAATSSGTSTSTSGTKHGFEQEGMRDRITASSTQPVIDAACMQSAVDKRDNAIITAGDAFAGTVKTALGVRRDAVKAAWGLTNKQERQAAIKAAWTAFRNAYKTARETFKGASKAAWSQFKTDAKACGTTSTGESSGSEVKF